jgi:biotin carboxyl carrier protein
MKKLKITVLGKTYEVLVEDLGEVRESAPTAEHTAHAPQSVPLAPIEVAPPTKVSAPMSGTVTSLSVAVGNTVQAGEALLVLEAMKMQNTIPAPKDGTVREVFVRKGDTVSSGDVLLILD